MLLIFVKYDLLSLICKISLYWLRLEEENTTAHIEYRRAHSRNVE